MLSWDEYEHGGVSLAPAVPVALSSVAEEARPEGPALDAAGAFALDEAEPLATGEREGLAPRLEEPGKLTLLRQGRAAQTRVN